MRDNNLEEAAFAVWRLWEEEKEAWDREHQTQGKGTLAKNDIVLLHNTKLNTNILLKLDYK